MKGEDEADSPDSAGSRKDNIVSMPIMVIGKIKLER